MDWTWLLLITAPLFTQPVLATTFPSDLSYCSSTSNTCLASLQSHENAPANCKACLLITETATPTLTKHKTLLITHTIDPAFPPTSTFTATEEITPTIHVTETATITAQPDLRRRDWRAFNQPRCPPKYANCEYEEYQSACACLGAGVETKTVSGFPVTVTEMSTKVVVEEQTGWAKLHGTAQPTITMTVTASKAVTETVTTTIWVEARR